MPIDLAAALGAVLPEQRLRWSSSDVLLYHLAIGAGASPTDPCELRYATEKDLHVLPTFAVVAASVHETQAPRVAYPGIEIELSRVLHGTQKITAHRTLPTAGEAVAVTRIAEIWDKTTAAVVVTETQVRDLDGEALWTNRSSIFAKGEGGFGGERGPSSPRQDPARAPDSVITTATLPQQALLYRLLGDRNPLHSDPAFAAAAGFPAPILHGLCTYAMVCKAMVDELLEGEVGQVLSFGVRFAGVVYPGESLQTSVWRDGNRLSARTTVPARGDAPALSDVELVLA
ncbi:MAG: MaoC family dehydratase N-terminal domain-containing protein [Actinomycetota bacterium]|nr:MaoC family dehydratase N-terminal domain-containing protein [Actinomycetota bacterium]